MTLILFHTADTVRDLFDELRAETPVAGEVRDLVRSDLLTRSVEAGGFTSGLQAETVAAMRKALSEAGEGAALLCTCSTIGPAADELREAGLPVSRVDRALAEEALGRGNRIAVLYTVETTRDPTRALFEEVAATVNPDAQIEMIHVGDAWAHFAAGDLDGYHRSIAAAIDGLADSYDAVALAQASMHGATRFTAREVLTSPGVSLAGLSDATA